MATTIDVEDLFDGPTILVQQVTVTGDDTTAEMDVVDISSYTGPDGAGNSAQVVTSRVSLLEASWNINSVVQSVKLYWTDEANDSLILTMSGDSSISYKGVGGKHYTLPGTFAADDADVELTYTNDDENDEGRASMWFVWRKKEL